MQIKKSDLTVKLNETCVRLFSCNLSETTEKQAYKAVCTVLREMLAKTAWIEYNHTCVTAQ